ncbi:hypothetical protein TNCV_1289391 [Trichonephila clavipes]|nr:hypothetical protein TNCV_1289391 [Trichonephila clavipes]
MHASHHWQRDCQTLANTPDISRISPATTGILATKASCWNRRGLHKFRWPQRKKSMQESSGELSGQFTGPFLLIHRPEYSVSNALRTSALKCAGAHSCWNHVRVFMLAGTLCS